MVKNTTGGSKHKGQARKLVSNFKQNNKLRIAEEEGEVYAQVIKMLGNGMCHVSSLDGVKRLCFIRGKFRGRGKRDNTLRIGTWLLIGLREWEMEKKFSETDLQKCDLLEVYSDLDKERLKKTVHCDWNSFIENDANFTNTKSDSNILFENEGGLEEYKEIMEKELNNTALPIRMMSLKEENEDQINIEDI